MVMFFQVMLGVSIAGLTLLLLLKRFELRTGRKVLKGMRPILDRFLHRGLVWVEYVIPDVVEGGIQQVGHTLASMLRRLALAVLHFFERKLEELLMRVRRTTHSPRSSKEASAFLRKVADHKRSIANDLVEVEDVPR